MLPTIFVLFLLANHADFLLQAYQHGWNTYWRLNPEAPKWGLLDFIPHDSWHWVQLVFHWSLVAGAAFSGMLWGVSWESLYIVVIYNVCRGLAFSLPVKISKSWS